MPNRRSLFAKINFQCIEIVFCPKPHSRSLGRRGVRASRFEAPSISRAVTEHGARACAGLPNHIPIDFYAEKSRLFTLPPFLLGRLSSKPNPFHSAEREAKTFHALHHLAPPSPVLSGSGPVSLSVSLSVARICSMHSVSSDDRARWSFTHLVYRRSRAARDFLRSLFIRSSDGSEP